MDTTVLVENRVSTAPAFTLAPRLPGTEVSQATIVINAAMARELTSIIDECCEPEDKALQALARQLENLFVRKQNPQPRLRTRRISPDAWGPSSEHVAAHAG